ncbi:hypothetical protein LTS18_007107, partial [Coniosporium uncinatum]
ASNSTSTPTTMFPASTSSGSTVPRLCLSTSPTTRLKCYPHPLSTQPPPPPVPAQPAAAESKSATWASFTKIPRSSSSASGRGMWSNW